MATPAEAEGEAEYESDPEDAPLPSMRRREASDDEDGEGSPPPARKDSRYDGDLDGQGGAPAYDDDNEEEFEEEELEEEELEVEEQARKDGGGGRYPRRGEGSAAAPQVAPHAAESGRDARKSGGEQVEFHGEDHEDEPEEVEEEVKKENEPYAVPTAGAFYMHDDRFRENGRGRHRRMPGGRKLWESKDDHAWVHDRFEEMNLQDTLYDEARRTSRGRFRGRGSGKAHGIDRGFGRGNRTRAYFDNDNNQNRAPKSFRGKGPRRYVPAPKSKSEVPETQQKQYTRPPESMLNNLLRRQSQESNSQPDRALPRKNVFASSLNSASPPFYPSGSSSQEISVTHKRDTQMGSANKATSTSLQMEDNFQATQSDSFLKGVHENGLSISGPPSYQQMPSLNQVTRVSSQINPSLIQQKPVQSMLQPAIGASTQQLGQRLAGWNQVSTLSPLSSRNSLEVGEMDSSSGSSKSKTQMVGKGKTSSQGSGKGKLLYNGTQLIGAAGAMGLPLGDHCFPGTPALLPVMQFSSQNPGGLGVPAVGMALPGYVAQSQLGFGNSEVTWMPVLAGAAGALGASYGSPCIPFDSSYYAHSSGQTSSSVSPSRESSSIKPATPWIPPRSPETVNDEYGQRQNKPRRYSEMNFGQ